MPSSSRAPASAAASAAASLPASVPISTPTPATESFSSATFAVPLSLSLVGGWMVQGDQVSDIDLQNGDQDAGILSISSTTVAGATSSDPPLAWPADLHAWLASRPEFKLQAPRAVTVGGRPAMQIDADASVPNGTHIELVCAEPRHSCFLLDHNDRWRFVEVKNSDGSGIVVVTNGIPAPGFDAYAQALDQLLTTLTFR